MIKEQSEHQTPVIPCVVSLGMFPRERGILIDLPDGRKISAFVDKSDIIADREPDQDIDIEGLLKVYVVEYKNGSVILDLPRPGLTEGPRLKIPATFLRWADYDSQ